ncbi:methyltransferase domain-containing protein [Cytophagales bacterium LB-30]|uniref:Methyltransferase domain-containing protein n=1 Tax=Shiella aurantiaca TaxID=3058365 RepID=A0ABT8F2U4_9BACT|nr:methyltransferase domain-containing protein [Shiella aurantiaca]MDN4164361.1 methyltransferase domain-containing protein [Shiella aurantiaca]
MKFHRNLSEAVVAALQQIFFEQRYADKALEQILQSNKRWGARDRAFIAETTYDIVRWWRMLSEVTGKAPASEADVWAILGAWLHLEGHELPAWSEFEALNLAAIDKKRSQISHNPAVEESVPDWLYELGQQEVGERWNKELHALNLQAEVVLRVNTIKTTRDQLQKQLDAEGYETLALREYPDALQLVQRQNVFKSAAFKEGMFEVQDANSQLVAAYMDVKPGMRVIDACAGAGGKTLHIAALMENKGKIIAMDTEAWKLSNLKQRARRAGVSSIEPRVIESQKTIKRLAASADRLLLDVPCSGMGVLKRNPDSKWKLSADFISSIQVTQQEILQKYSKMLKPDGVMVYSTCSILPSENRKQVDAFLASEAGKDFTLLKDDNLMPAISGYDGFYMAQLKRKA